MRQSLSLAHSHSFVHPVTPELVRALAQQLLQIDVHALTATRSLQGAPGVRAVGAAFVSLAGLVTSDGGGIRQGARVSGNFTVQPPTVAAGASLPSLRVTVVVEVRRGRARDGRSSPRGS